MADTYDSDSDSEVYIIYIYFLMFLYCIVCNVYTAAVGPPGGFCFGGFSPLFH